MAPLDQLEEAKVLKDARWQLNQAVLNVVVLKGAERTLLQALIGTRLTELEESLSTGKLLSECCEAPPTDDVDNNDQPPTGRCSRCAENVAFYREEEPS